MGIPTFSGSTDLTGVAKYASTGPFTASQLISKNPATSTDWLLKLTGGASPSHSTALLLDYNATRALMLTATGGAAFIGSNVGLSLSGNASIDADAPGNPQLKLDSGGGIGVFNVTPQARPTAYTQTYATATRTHAADTATDLVTTAATQTSPWGFASSAQANNIATQHNALRVDLDNLKQLVNSVIDDFQGYGWLA
jgi:hypothetical protein